MKETYKDLLEDDIFSNAFRYIVLNNTSNNAPYHHFHHMMTVTHYVMKGGFGIGLPAPEYYELVLAAMFHDMNHSMGEVSDEINVTRAINAMFDWADENSDLISKDRVQAIADIIKATQYPYIIEAKDLSIRQAIIRDADLMIALEPDSFQNMFFGLMKEMKVQDIKLMIAGQISFHKEIKMNTEWGRMMYKNEWEDKVFGPLRLLQQTFDK